MLADAAKSKSVHRALNQMGALLRTGSGELAASSPALCSLDKTTVSTEGPCSSASEQSCLFRSQSRSLLVDNCSSESLAKTRYTPKSAKRKRAEDVLANTYAKSVRKDRIVCSAKSHRLGGEDVIIVPPCPTGECGSR